MRSGTQGVPDLMSQGGGVKVTVTSRKVASKRAKCRLLFWKVNSTCFCYFSLVALCSTLGSGDNLEASNQNEDGKL